MNSEQWQQVEEFYHAALDQPAERRAAFLKKACSDDALRREVESLLASDRPDDTVLDSPAWERRLSPGQCIGPYQIVSRIGAGGMGEVWKARDTRLGREVALKVSASRFSDRFKREARAIAALNHPLIYTLFDVGADCLVMEYIEGQPVQGPLPLDQVLKLGAQIADALSAAHRKGIIHRDLKPANILVTGPKERPQVKLLDFGLAKMDQASAHAAGAALPYSETRDGAILGTLQYMAPEQLQGRETDARSDIFSLGCVLYELLAGRRAFEGSDSASITAAILKEEPPPLTAPPASGAFSRLLRKCLAKDPDDRWQSASDLRDELLWIASGEAQAGPAPTAPVAERRRPWLPWVVAGLFAVAAAVAAGTAWLRPKPVGGPAVRSTLDLSPAESLAEGSVNRPTQTAFAFSPDGNTLVFRGFSSKAPGTGTQLYRRALDQSEAVPIPGTDGAGGPFFSSDGKWVGFWADGKLKKVSLSGGPAVNICDVRLEPWAATWGSAGVIVFASSGIDPPEGSLVQVSADGGTPKSLIKRVRHEFYTAPEFLPDGKTVLFTARHTYHWEDAQIVALRPGGEQRVLVKGGAGARYVPTGHLVYMLNGALMAVPFDADRLETTGTSVPLLDGVMQNVNMPSNHFESATGQFAVSRSGHLVYATGGIFPPRISTLVRLDRKGTVTDLNLPKGRDVAMQLSPDGQRLVVTRFYETSRSMDIWAYDLVRGTAVPLTNHPQSEDAIWSRDGKRVIFSGNTEQLGLSIRSIMADGQGTLETIAGGGGLLPRSLSPDGKWLAYLKNGANQIWVRPMSGPGEPKLFLESKFALQDAEFSPDGKWLAYSSNESGAQEVYVQAFPGPGEKHLISTNGGLNPAWAPNGRELFYLGQCRRPGAGASMSCSMMAVDIASGGAFKAGAPRKLFEGGPGGTYPGRSYDVYPDGQHFIMAKYDELPDQRVTRLNLVLNWFEELKRRVPRNGR